MEIVFRADGGRRLGGGHLARCRAVAQVAADAGHPTRLCCTAETVEQAPSFMTGPWRVDVLRTMDEIPHDLSDSAVLVDHYSLDVTWETVTSCAAARLVVLDDLDRPHPFGVPVVRPGVAPRPDRSTLVGPAWLPLHPSVIALRRVRGPCGGGSHGARVVVMPGLVDGRDLAGHVLAAVSSFAPSLRRDIDLHVIVGSVARHLTKLRAATAACGARLHLDLVNPLPLLASADVGVGTAGVAAWERAALALPSVAVQVVENQRDAANLLDELGGAAWVGRAQNGALPDIGDALASLLNSPAARSTASAAAAASCDGRGAWRVAALLVPSLAEPSEG